MGMLNFLSGGKGSSPYCDLDARLITSVLPKGSGKPLLEALHAYGVTTANLYFTRGSDIGDSVGKHGLPEQVEKDIVTVAVSKKESAAVFDLVLEKSGVDRPGGGIVYVTPLAKSVPFTLPEIQNPETPDETPARYGENIPLDPGARQITCILPKGEAEPVLHALFEHGVPAANLSFARGFDPGDAPGKDGLPQQVEKDILTVVVAEKKADEIFEFVYETAKVARPGGGIVYMGMLRKSVPFVLPDLAGEKSVTSKAD